MAVPFDPMSGAVFPFDPAMFPLGQGQATPQPLGPGPILDPNDPRLLQPQPQPEEMQFAPDDFSHAGVPGEGGVFQLPEGVQSAGGSVSGVYNPAQADRVAGDIRRSANPQEAAVDAQTGAMAGRQMEELGAATGGVDEATRALADSEARGLEARQKVLEHTLSLQQRLDTADRAAYEITRAEVQAGRARMEQQIAANRAMTVDPTLNFTAGESLGNAASLFAQGFLQAGYGIKIDVAGTLERWTDRYVNNQMEKIRRGERLAEQDRVVWEMIRAEAIDEQDARDRYRAFAMSQAATSMEIEAMRFGSEIARAKGAEQAAQARLAFANNMHDLENRWFDVGWKMKQDIRDDVYRQRALGIQAFSARTDRMRLDAQTAPVARPKVYSFDTGEAVGQVREWALKDETAMRNLGTVQSRAQRIVKAANTLKEMQKKYGSIPADSRFLSGLQSDDSSLILAARADLFSALREDTGSGANLTGNEESFIKDQIKMDTYINRLTETGSSRVLDQLRNRAIEDANTKARPYIENLDGSDRAWEGNFAESTQTQARLGVDNAPAPVTRAKKLGGEITAPGAQIDTAPSEFSRAAGVKGATAPFGGGWLGTPEGERVPEWVVPMENLARDLFARPITGGKGEGAEEFTQEGADRLRSEAKAALNEIVWGPESRSPANRERREAALKTLELYRTDPDRLMRMLGVDPWGN